MDVLSTFDIHADFFAYNPQLKIVFSEVEEEKKDDASQFMGAVALFAHPDSKFSNTSDDYRKQIISDDYFDPNGDDDFTKATIIKFQDLCLTKKERFLVGGEKKLEERSRFIDEIEYGPDTFEMLDKMMGLSDRLWKRYMDCLKDVEEERAHVSGGAIESLSEQNII